MTQSRQPEDRDLITRVARLEYRLTQIENTNTQLQETIAPGGYVTDAFERVVDRIEDEKAELKADIQEVNTKLDSFKAEVNQRFDSQDAKLDILIRAMTGMGQE
jgi:uncharacterized protein (UPF0335 family)